MAFSRAMHCSFALALVLFSAFLLCACSGSQSSMPKSICLPWVEADTGHTDSVLSLGYCNGGGMIVSAGGDVRTWDTFNGRLSDAYSAPSKTYQIAVSGAHVIAICKGNKAISILDFEKKEPLREIALPGGTKMLIVAMTYDGKTVASGGFGGDVILWDVSSGNQLKSWKAHSGEPIASLAFSRDGRILATGSTDSTIKLWNVPAGNLLQTLSGHKSTVSALSFDSDGNKLASGSGDNSVKVWDVKTGKETCTCTGHEAAVTAVCFNRSDDSLASASEDKSVRLWSPSLGSLDRTFTCGSTVHSVAFNPRDGKTLATGRGDGNVQIWNLAGDKDYEPHSMTDSRTVLTMLNNDTVKKRSMPE